jgi:hypothetical protein
MHDEAVHEVRAALAQTVDDIPAVAVAIAAHQREARTGAPYLVQHLDLAQPAHAERQHLSLNRNALPPRPCRHSSCPATRPSTGFATMEADPAGSTLSAGKGAVAPSTDPSSFSEIRKPFFSAERP